jgi:hypothetical protein
MHPDREDLVMTSRHVFLLLLAIGYEIRADEHLAIQRGEDRATAAAPDLIAHTPTRSGLSLEKWTVIQADDSRPRQAFGLAWGDFRGGGYQDIVSGSFYYRNPGGDLIGKWSRVRLPNEIDAMLVTDMDGDGRPDVLAEKLPDVYWLKPLDKECREWKAALIGTIPRTPHGNGQGYAAAQIVPGGKPEIVLCGGDGIYYFQIPVDPTAGNWPRVHVTPDASEQGLSVEDINGDGLPDLIAGKTGGEVIWYENPGDRQPGWIAHPVGAVDPRKSTEAWRDGDRFGVTDANGDGRPDIFVTEETPLEDAAVFWFEQPADPKRPFWRRHRIVSQFTTISMDLADMDHDDRVDLIIAEHRGTKKLSIWTTTDRAATWKEHVVSQGIENHLGARVVDLDGDGDLDIIGIAWDKFQNLTIWRNDAIISPRSR